MASDDKISQLPALGAEPDSADDFVVRDDSAGSTKKVSKSNLLGSYIKELSGDSTPQLGGDLDLNGNAFDFPTATNISDTVTDLNSASTTSLATSKSIKDYIDNNTNGAPVALDLGNDGSDESTDLTRINIANDTNSIVSKNEADEVLFDFSNNYPTADEVAINALTDLGASVAGGDEVAVADVDDSNNIKKTTVQDIANLASGSAVALDLANDDSLESSDLNEIATTGDTNSIFTKPTANKLLIDASSNWPTADSAAGLESNALDAIGEISSSLRTGSDTTLVTGTAGTDQNLIEWDSNGDAIDSGIAAGDVVTPSSTDTLTNKTFDANGTGNSLSNVEVADFAPNAISGGGSTIPTALTKNFTVEDSNGLSNSENITFFFTNRAITITEINDVIQGSSTPSIDYDIHHASARDNGTPNEVIGTDRTLSSTSGASKTGSFNDADIPADSWIWVVTSSVSGVVTELSLNVKFTLD